jgi:hypothetical protein
MCISDFILMNFVLGLLCIWESRQKKTNTNITFWLAWSCTVGMTGPRRQSVCHMRQAEQITGKSNTQTLYASQGWTYRPLLDKVSSCIHCLNSLPPPQTNPSAYFTASRHLRKCSFPLSSCGGQARSTFSLSVLFLSFYFIPELVPWRS